MQQLFCAVRFAGQSGSAIACRASNLHNASLSLQTWHLTLAANASAASTGAAHVTRSYWSSAVSAQAPLAQLFGRAVKDLLRHRPPEACGCAAQLLSRSGKCGACHAILCRLHKSVCLGF